MNLRQQYTDFFLDIYDQVDFVPLSGKGSRLFGANNEEIIDFAGGIAVNALGHAHPDLIRALTEQAHKLWHVSNVMVNQPAVRLGKALVENSCFDKAFICNSGTEAVEAALKLARRYASKNYGPDKHKIVAFKNSFHGRTLFAVSVGGQAKYSEDFAPLPPGICHGVFNDMASAEALIDEYTAAVIVEPIQAEGGVIPALPEFLVKLRTLCDQHQALLIFDEVQTGMGRTGKLFAYEHYQVEPDVMSIAKALGGGFPIAALLVKAKFSSGFSFGSHGTTFGGNPLACAVASQALSIINTPELLAEVVRRGKLFKHLLTDINQKLKFFNAIRGTGLLIGAELADAYQGQARNIMCRGFKNGVAVLTASTNVLRITPSLIIPEVDIYQGMERLYRTLLTL
jgi:predicted acetylornithine/succinylornithine family transaminase